MQRGSVPDGHQPRHRGLGSEGAGAGCSFEKTSQKTYQTTSGYGKAAISTVIVAGSGRRVLCFWQDNVFCTTPPPHSTPAFSTRWPGQTLTRSKPGQILTRSYLVIDQV